MSETSTELDALIARLLGQHGGNPVAALAAYHDLLLAEPEKLVARLVDKVIRECCAESAERDRLFAIVAKAIDRHVMPLGRMEPDRLTRWLREWLTAEAEAGRLSATSEEIDRFFATTVDLHNIQSAQRWIDSNLRHDRATIGASPSLTTSALPVRGKTRWGEAGVFPDSEPPVGDLTEEEKLPPLENLDAHGLRTELIHELLWIAGSGLTDQRTSQHLPFHGYDAVEFFCGWFDGLHANVTSLIRGRVIRPGLESRLLQLVTDALEECDQSANTMGELSATDEWLEVVRHAHAAARVLSWRPAPAPDDAEEYSERWIRDWDRK